MTSSPPLSGLLRGHRGQAPTRAGLPQYTQLAMALMLLVAAFLGMEKEEERTELLLVALLGMERRELLCHLLGERERQEEEHSRRAAARSPSLQQTCCRQMSQSVDLHLAVDQSHLIHTHHHRTSHMIGHMTQLPPCLHTVISHMISVVTSSAANRLIHSVKTTPFLRNR